MAYKHSQLARECGSVKTPSARLLLMVLASAMDKDKHTCNWRVSTVLHYTKLSLPTYKRAMNEIELAGIITRSKRLGKSSTFIWHPDVAESLRDPVKKEWAEPSAEDKENMERMDAENPEQLTVSKAVEPDEEFPCSQCRVEPVDVAGARCYACRHADLDKPRTKAAAASADAPAPHRPVVKAKTYKECRSDDDHKFADGNPKCLKCNVSRSLIEDSIRERNERMAEFTAKRNPFI